MVRKHIMYGFHSFKFAEVSFMSQEVVYLGLCSISTWKKIYIYALLLECSLNIDYILLFEGIARFFYILAIFLSSCPNPFLREDCWSLQLNCGSVYFSFQFYQLCSKYFATVFWCIHISHCYVIVQNWHFYKYIMPLSVPIKFLILKPNLCDTYITTHCFL